MIKLFSTFTGVGGFELALQRTIGEKNVEIVGYSEIDKFAIQTYEQHFNAKNYGDITKIDIDNMPDFDLLTGGFPCQDVSVAGKQNLEGGRTVLVEYLLQMLEKKQPKYFVFENVKGLMSKKFTTFRDSIFERINSAGYKLDYKVLNTKDFGIPQNRERVYMVGQRNDIAKDYEFPVGKELDVFLKDILEEEVEEKFYMTEEQYNKLSYESIKRIYTSISPTLNTSQGGHRQPKILFNKFNNRIMENVSGTLGTGSGFTNKQGYMVCSPLRSREFTGFKDIAPIFCARDYKDQKQMTNGIVIRKLTPTEYERLQNFPDNRTGICSNSQRYKQMGNAITVKVAEEVFKKLFNKKGLK